MNKYPFLPQPFFVDFPVLGGKTILEDEFIVLKFWDDLGHPDSSMN